MLVDLVKLIYLNVMDKQIYIWKILFIFKTIWRPYASVARSMIDPMLSVAKPALVSLLLKVKEKKKEFVFGCQNCTKHDL